MLANIRYAERFHGNRAGTPVLRASALEKSLRTTASTAQLDAFPSPRFPEAQ